MKTRFLALLTLFLCVNVGLAQVKIGEDPDNIDPASLVELESSDKAFVLTRVDDVRMTSIVPLNGAMVYNTTTQCIHYFDGTQWINLCEAANSGFSFADNGDGTFTLDDGVGNSITWNGEAETVTTLVDNMDGSFSYTNENGTVVTINVADADDQNLSGNFNLTTSELSIDIEDGASAVVDLSTLEESADIAVNSADIATNATDIATNATDIATNMTDIATNATDIAAHIAADLDVDNTNELNSAVAFDGTNLTVTDTGGSLSADISALAYDDTAIQAQVATNTTDIATNVTDIATNATDIATNATDIATNTTDITTNATDIATNASDIATNATDIATNTTDIATNAIDIATNATDIATNATDIATNTTDIATNATDIAAHITADGDLDSANELNSAVAFDGTNLTVTDAGGNLSADISALAYDDTAIQAQVATNTADIATNATNIATNVTDIATNSTDIATNATDIATNATDIATNTTDIATNATDIATHIAADGDLYSTNELNSAVAFDGTNLTVTDAGGNLSADISALAYDDTAIQAQVATNTADIATNVTDIAANATDIATNAADIATNATDIATNTTDIATNATDIATHIAADGDLDSTNELNSAVAFDGTNLTVSDAGGSLSADISALAYDDTAIQAQVATNTTDIATNATDIATNVTDIATNATDIATNTTDITTNATDIAANATDIATNVTDIATNATDIATNVTDIAAHIAADGDLDSTNELNSAVAFDGTNLTVSDAGGSLSADISALAYDDTAIQAQVATNTTDISTNATDIAANATDIATNVTDIATNATDIATNATDIATNATDIATNVTDIATNATDIAAHITADLDTDNTNEIQTLSKTGNTITLSDGGGSVNETVTSLSQAASGVITYTDEASGTQTANVVSTDADNAISAGSDGGAYYGGYEKVVIWAEEAAALSSNTLEWSFGNGSTGQIGIPLPEEWEAYAVSFNADISGAGDTVTMAVINAGTNSNLFTFTASGATNNIVYTQILATPVTIPAGTAIGFRTVTEVGAVSDARVAVWLRRRP